MDIRTLCLGMLTMGDASGYEIKKIFEGPLRHFFDASYGSIYPALGKLTEDGLVTCTEHVQDKRPDKKVYRIAPRGRMAFMDELAHPPGRDRFRSEFVAILLFADLLPAGHLSRLIDQRISDYRGHIAELEQCAPSAKTAGGKFVNGMGLAVYRAALEYLEENRHHVESEALLSRSKRAEPVAG